MHRRDKGVSEQVTFLRENAAQMRNLAQARIANDETATKLVNLAKRYERLADRLDPPLRLVKS